MKVYTNRIHEISVGDYLDWTEKEFGFTDTRSEETAARECRNENPKVVTRGCVVENIKDICNLLDIPPQLVLKVRIGQVTCLPVAEIVNDLYDENVLTVVFQVECCLFTEEELENDPENTQLKQPCSESTPNYIIFTEEELENDPESTQLKQPCSESTPNYIIFTEEELENDPENTQLKQPCSESTPNFSSSHISKVSGKDWGRKLIVVLKLNGRDIRTQDEIFKIDYLSEKLKDSNMVVNEKLFQKLTTKWAEKMDKKLDERKHQGTKAELSLHYFGFSSELYTPITVREMMYFISNFQSTCQNLMTSCSDQNYDRDYSSVMSHIVKEPRRTDSGNIVTTATSRQQENSVCQLAVTLKVDSMTGSQNNCFELAENLLKIMMAERRATSKFKTIEDPAQAVIRTDHKREQIFSKQKCNLERIEEAVRKMALSQTSTIDWTDICRFDPLQECLKINDGNQLDLVLLGKTGQGKSSTGNSLLMGDIFKVSSNVVSQTSENDLRKKDIDGRMLNVVDTPGFFDTRLNENRIKECFLSVLSDVMLLQPEGFHALLYVFKYGEKLSEDHKNALGLLKRALSDDVVKNHVVCIITGGDVFKEENNNFDNWCHDTGSEDLNEFFEECQYRCVLFINKTGDTDVKKYQLIRLVSIVDSIPSRYTSEVFEQTKNEREEMLREEMSPEKRKDIENYLYMLSEQVNNGEVLDEEALESLDEQEQIANILAQDDKRCICKYINEIRTHHTNQQRIKIMKDNEKKKEEQIKKQEQLRTKGKKEIANYLQYISEELDNKNVINKTLSQKLDSLIKEKYEYLTKDDLQEIQERKDSFKEMSEKIQKENIEMKRTEKIKEIDQFLKYVDGELNKGNKMDDETLRNLEKYEIEAIKQLHERDYQAFQERMKKLRCALEKNLAKKREEENRNEEEEKMKEQKSHEIMKFLQNCENNLKEGNELDLVTKYDLNKYEKYAKQYLTEDRYKSIQSQIEDLMMKSDFIRSERIKEEKTKYEGAIRNEIKHLLEEVEQYIKDEKLIPEKKIEKLNFYEIAAKEKLTMDDTARIIKDITSLMYKAEEMNEKLEVKCQREKTVKEINSFLDNLTLRLENPCEITKKDFALLWQYKEVAKTFPDDEKEEILQRIETVRKRVKKKADSVRCKLRKLWKNLVSLFFMCRMKNQTM